MGQTAPTSVPTARPGGRVPGLPEKLPGKSTISPFRRPGGPVPSRVPSRVPKTLPQKPPQRGHVAKPTGPPLSSLQSADPLLLEQLFPPEQDPAKAPQPGACERPFKGGQCPELYALTAQFPRAGGPGIISTVYPYQVYGPIQVLRVVQGQSAYTHITTVTAVDPVTRQVQTWTDVERGGAPAPIMLTPIGHTDDCGDLPLPAGCTPGGHTGAPLPQTKPKPVPQTVPTTLPRTLPKPILPPGETEVVPFKRPRRPPSKAPPRPLPKPPAKDPPKPPTPSEPSQPEPPQRWDPGPPTRQPTKPAPSKQPVPQKPTDVPPVPLRPTHPLPGRNPTEQPSPVPTPLLPPTPQPRPTPQVVPQPQPQPVPTPQPAPVPTPIPTPQKVPQPQPAPVPTPQPAPIPPPTPTPTRQPKPRPTPTPQAVPSPVPGGDDGKPKPPPGRKGEIGNLPGPEAKPSPISQPQRRKAHDTQNQQPPSVPLPNIGEFPTELPAPEPETEPECDCNPPLEEDEETMVIRWKSIQVPVVECHQDSATGVFTPLRKLTVIPILATKTGNEAAKVVGMYEALAAANEKLCEQCNPPAAVASLPELWELKASNQRNQLQVSYKRADNTNRSRWHLTIPHFDYALREAFSPPAYQKGKYACSLTLADNSHLLVNAHTPAEGKRVITYFNAFIERSLQGNMEAMQYSYVPRRNILEVEVTPVFLKYFEPDDIVPRWTKTLTSL